MANIDIAALRNIVRVGEVSSIESDGTRVIFHDKEDMVSETLPVLYAGAEWTPQVGQRVLCLYLPHGECDGFILGAI